MPTRMVTNNQQAFTLGDAKFTGLDTYNSPNKLQEGYFQKLDNLQIYGNTLQPRNGWNTCWHSTTGSPNFALPQPIWETVALKDNGQQSKIVFTCNSKLYYWDTTTYGTSNNQPVEILDRTTGTSFAFSNSENVRMVSFGQYIYGVAGGSQALFRVRMNDNVVEGESIPQLVDVSPYSPIATATSIIVRALSNTNKSAIDTTSFGSVPTVFVSATVTLGTATIAYVTPASSRFIANQPVVFSTSTVTNIVAGTTYYVISTGLVSTGFQISASIGGTAITPTGGTGGTFVVRADGANVLNNGAIASSTASGFGEWNYNTGDTQRITSGTKLVGGITYNVFSNTAKNPDNYILTRDGATGFCLKIDQAQDYFFQDIDVRNVLVTKDETPLAFTGTASSSTLTIAGGHNLVVGQIIRFTVTVAGLTAGTNYYVKSITTTTLTVTTDSTLAGAAVTLTSPGVTLGATYIIPQHNAGLYALTFYAYNQDDLTNFVSQNNIDVTVQGYWKTASSAFSSSNEIAGAVLQTTVEIAAGQSSADWQKIQIIVDFRLFDKILTGLKFRVQAAFNRGGDSFVYLDDFTCHPVNSRFQLSDTQDDPKGLVKINTNQANNTFINEALPTNPFVDYVQNEYVKINITPTVEFTASINNAAITTSAPHGLNVGNAVLFTTTVGGTSTSTTYYVKGISSPTQFVVTTDQTLIGNAFVFTANVAVTTNYYQATVDLRNVQSISVASAFSDKINQSVPPFSLGIRNGNSMYFTGQCTYDKDQGFLTWALFPITTSVRTQVAAVYIKNDFDLNGFYNNEWVISFGDVVRQGSLTPDSIYTYTFSLWRPYALPTTTATPSWASVNFTAALSGTLLTTSTAHNLGVGSMLTFTGTTGGVSTTTTYYVKTVPSTTTFTITTDSSLIGTTFQFSAAVTLGANQFTPTPEVPSGNGFETVPSKLSNEVTVTSAINSVTLSIPYTCTQLKNGLTGSNPIYKYCLIYRNNARSGGVQPKLIGFIDLDTGSVYSSGSVWKGLTTSSSGVSTNLTITDQVEDSSLFFDNGPGTLGYRLRTGKDQFPVGADVVSTYNQRLFVSKKNAIYASWLLNPGNEYGVYTTLLPDVTDPEVAIKGTQFSISNKTDEEQIQAMIAVQGDGLMRDNSTTAAMVIMRERSTYLLTGDSPHNFASQGFLQQGTAGLVAKRGYATVMNRLVYLTASGLMELQSTVLTPKSIALEGVLNINSQNFTTQSNNYISPALYSKVVVASQDRRIIMLAPTQTDNTTTANSRTYVYDHRNQGWFTWINPVGFTSLVVLEAADDTQELYAGGRDGKLYKLESWSDNVYASTANTTRTSTPISWEINTRQYGQTFAEGAMYYSANKLHSLLLHIDNQATTEMYINWSITSIKGYSTTGIYAWHPSTNEVVSLRSISRTADAQAFNINLTGSTSHPWRMFALHATTTEGNTPRT